MRIADERCSDRGLVRIVDPSVTVDIVWLAVVVGVDDACPDDVALPGTDAVCIRRNLGEASGETISTAATMHRVKPPTND